MLDGLVGLWWSNSLLYYRLGSFTTSFIRIFYYLKKDFGYSNFLITDKDYNFY